jgi:Organic solute transporter Ostalpha
MLILPSLSPSALIRYDAVFAALRDCYEAYAVYTFIALLIAILEDGKGLPQLLNKVRLLMEMSVV